MVATNTYHLILIVTDFFLFVSEFDKDLLQCCLAKAVFLYRQPVAS